jgi:hypothetical protein
MLGPIFIYISIILSNQIAVVIILPMFVVFMLCQILSNIKQRLSPLLVFNFKKQNSQQ